MQVTPYSGMPGAWAAVRLRGVANVTGYSQPLYLVDGVPMYNTEVSPEQWSGAYQFYNRQPYGLPREPTPFAPGGNPLLDLPVEDVASVEIIKDAAGTARYGLQGGHGVISIKTRRGGGAPDGPQPPRVRYAAYAGLQQVRRRYQLLDGQQYLDLTQQAWANTGRTTSVFPPDELARRGSVDWQDRLFRPAGMHSHNLSLDGASRSTRYYAAADYLAQQGVLTGSQLRRYSLRIGVDQQLGPRLGLSLKAAGSQLDQQQPGTEPDAGNLILAALRTAPLGTERNSQGQPRYLDPELLATSASRRPRTRRTLVQLGASYLLRPDLTLSLRASREAATIRETVDNTPIQLAGAPSYNIVTESSRTDLSSWVYQADLRYQHRFGKRHDLTATASYQRQQYTQQWSNGRETSASNGSTYSRYFYQNTTGNMPLHSPSVAACYVLDGRYELQASLRADHWVNPQPQQDTTFWFPGAQLRWQLHQEPRLQPVLQRAAWLNKLTAYAGIGRTAGNLLAWGCPSTQLDAGLSAELLGGWLRVTAAVYQRRTRHAPTVINNHGFDVTLRNRGTELTVDLTRQWGPLSSSTTLAAATNFTRVQQIAFYTPWPRQRNEVESIPGTGLEVGKPLARWFVYAEDGFYPVGSSQAGQLRYRDVNQDGQLTGADGHWQGSGLPRYTLGIVEQLSYRRLQIDLQLDGLFGYQISNPTLFGLDTPNGGTNKTTAALEYWTPTNQNTTIPAPYYNGYSIFPTAQRLASGNHLRLSQLQLSYALLRTERRQLSLWAGGQNLLVISSYRGYDPNVATGGASPLLAGQDPGAYPVARVWQLGLRGQF